MTSGPHRALILGSPGRYPFNGHLRLALRSGAARLHLAAVVAPGCEPPVAHAATVALRAQLVDAEGSGRFDLLRSAWDLLAGIDPSLLGPARGGDLALLLVAWDDEGLGVAGTGLDALHALGTQVEPLLEGAHPLFGIRGVPANPPGLFTPHEPPAVVVGSPATGALDPSAHPSWALACGYRAGGAA